MITLNELLKEYDKADDLYFKEILDGNINLSYCHGPAIGKLIEGDEHTLDFLKKHEISQQDFQSLARKYYRICYLESQQIYENDNFINKEKYDVNKKAYEVINKETCEDEIIKMFYQKTLSSINGIIEKHLSSYKEKRNFAYLYMEYELHKKDYKNQEKQDKVYSLYDESLKNNSEYRKYGLIPVNNQFVLEDLYPPRIYDSFSNRTMFTQKLSKSLALIILQLKNEGFIKRLSVRVNNDMIFSGKEERSFLLEHKEWGEYYLLSNMAFTKLSLTKLYDDEYKNFLWVKHNNNEVTFEEVSYDNELQQNDYVSTNMVHLKYDIKGKKCFIEHIDNERIFYTPIEFRKRQTDYTVKGTAKPRIKFFKINDACIPEDYKVKLDDVTEKNNKLIVPFIVFVVYECFSNKKLVQEYFQKVIKTCA